MAFLRSAAGDDPVNRLWVLEVATGVERLVADPAALLGGGEGDLPPEERARRERARERAGGIVAFAADLDLTVASFALAGRLFVADLRGPGGVRELPAGAGVLDPRVDPTGARVAWVADRALHVAPVDGGGSAPPARLAGEDDPRSAGGWPSSWPPRRWTGRGGSGGPRTGSAWPWPGSTCTRCGATT